MTLVRNRATRIEDRRLVALGRLKAGLASGIRFTDEHGDCPHDAASRALAQKQIAILERKLAKPAAITFTRKSKSFGEWTTARKLARAGKLA